MTYMHETTAQPLDPNRAASRANLCETIARIFGVFYTSIPELRIVYGERAPEVCAQGDSLQMRFARIEEEFAAKPARLVIATHGRELRECGFDQVDIFDTATRQWYVFPIQPEEEKELF